MKKAVTAAATKTTPIPRALKKWITDFCAARTSVRVGHMMFATDENLSNIKLEEALYLIRTHEPIAQFMGKDRGRQRQIAEHVAAAVAATVLKSFKTARYPGD